MDHAQNLGISEDGGINDGIIEKMFSDVHYGTYIEDDITRGNLNIYLKIFYGDEYEIHDLEDTRELITIIMSIFKDISLQLTADDTFVIRVDDWPENHHVEHASMSSALALVIIEDLRQNAKSYLAQLNRGKRTAH